nr:hypothetical protein CFP56_13365 [Quercus suber]
MAVLTDTEWELPTEDVDLISHKDDRTRKDDTIILRELSPADEIVVSPRRPQLTLLESSKRKKKPASGSTGTMKRRCTRSESVTLPELSGLCDQSVIGNVRTEKWVRRSTRLVQVRASARQKAVQAGSVRTPRTKPARKPLDSKPLSVNLVGTIDNYDPSGDTKRDEDNDDLSSAMSGDELEVFGPCLDSASTASPRNSPTEKSTTPTARSAVDLLGNPTTPKTSLQVPENVRQMMRGILDCTPQHSPQSSSPLSTPISTSIGVRRLSLPASSIPSLIVIFRALPKIPTSTSSGRITKVPERFGVISETRSRYDGGQKKIRRARAKSTSNKLVSSDLQNIQPQVEERHTPERQVLLSGLLTPPDTQASFTGYDPVDESPLSVVPPSVPVSTDLAKLAETMCHKQPLDMKPLPCGEPLVWAESRQALTETVPYFKKPQGGCHSKDRHVYCFLFDDITHARAHMDEDIIIARAGGGMESDSSGQMRQGKNQSIKDTQVQAVLNNIAYRNPLVVITGDRNVDCPTRLPHKYCVLGWYKPTEVWAEKTSGKGNKMWTTIMYRFERLGSGMLNASKPWFAANNAIPLDCSNAGPLHQQTCDACGKQYPQRYLLGWICLNEICSKFWLVNGEQVAPGGSFLYNPAWLLHRTSWPDETEPASVKQPVHEIGRILGDNLTKINTKGICCPDCGRCNSRRLFTGWVCENPRCSWQYFPEHRIIMPAALHTPWDNFGHGPTLSRARHGVGVRVESTTVFGYKVTTWTIDGIDGRIIHAAANKTINEQPGGPNEMLAALQSEDLGLERRRFRGEKLSRTGPSKLIKVDPTATDVTELELTDEADDENGIMKKSEFEDGDMMMAFSMNYGMPYKFIASGTSMSFDRAPWPVRGCRSMLNWAVRTFLGLAQHGKGVDIGFNEELIFAYMEGQKLEYHDDGETGLGPTIGSLSLGGKSTMSLRMKSKYHVGCSKQGILTTEPPLPHCIGGDAMYQRRLAAWESLRPLKDWDPREYQRRLKTLPKDLGLYEKRNKKADDSIVVPLAHGDILLMDGYDIQKYLEHKVVAEDHLRFALTCRTVLPGHLSPAELPPYEVGPDAQGYEGGELGRIYGRAHTAVGT